VRLALKELMVTEGKKGPQVCLGDPEQPVLLEFRGQRGFKAARGQPDSRELLAYKGKLVHRA
jgi:hypothetical protein